MSNKSVEFDRSELNYARKLIREKLGNETVNELHRQNLLLDAMIFVFVCSCFVVNMLLLARMPVGVLWLCVFVFQGALSQVMMLVSHDLFVHRKVGGDFWSWVGSMFMTIPRFSLPSGYEQAHLAHHRYIGTDRDTEAYKQDIDTRSKRVLFSTAVGVKLAQSNKFSPAKRKAYHSVEDLNEKIIKRAQIEKLFMRGWMLVVFILCLWYPSEVLIGYLLPVLTILPILNTLRIIIEHGDANPDNPFNRSTFYETGLITRLMFLWDSGDCHIVHHIFPRMPWYRVGKAVDLMNPIFEAEGAVKRTSFLKLIYGWYFKNFEHRTQWPL